MTAATDPVLTSAEFLRAVRRIEADYETRQGPPVSGPKTHGPTCDGYVNHGCRCDDCRAAWRAYNRKRRAERRALIAEDPTVAIHGLNSTYTNWGCRCPRCTDAHTAESARQRSEATS